MRWVKNYSINSKHFTEANSLRNSRIVWNNRQCFGKKNALGEHTNLIVLKHILDVGRCTKFVFTNDMMIQLKA